MVPRQGVDAAVSSLVHRSLVAATSSGGATPSAGRRSWFHMLEPVRQAFYKGYELWASDVNNNGGILGRKVTLKILNDNSTPNQVVTNYQTLFGSDHVDLAFGPFSSLLSGPASSVAARYGMASVEGAGGAPSVFDTPSNQADHNVFDVSLPIADELVPLVNWIRSLPAGERPKTAAYPMAQDPFADPPVQLAETLLSSPGPLNITPVYNAAPFTEEVADYAAPADQVAACGATAASAATSDWFRNPRLPGAGTTGNGDGDGPTAAAGQTDGEGFIGTDGWAEGQQAAQIIADPVRGDRTAAGLPIRVPRANLLPGSAGGAHRAGAPTRRPGGSHETPASAASRPQRSPELAQSRLSGFQRGIRRARSQPPRADQGADR
jgi:Periplasmic binding protein